MAIKSVKISTTPITIPNLKSREPANTDIIPITQESNKALDQTVFQHEASSAYNLNFQRYDTLGFDYYSTTTEEDGTESPSPEEGLEVEAKFKLAFYDANADKATNKGKFKNKLKVRVKPLRASAYAPHTWGNLSDNFEKANEEFAKSFEKNVDTIKEMAVKMGKNLLTDMFATRKPGPKANTMPDYINHMYRLYPTAFNAKKDFLNEKEEYKSTLNSKSAWDKENEDEWEKQNQRVEKDTSFGAQLKQLGKNLLEGEKAYPSFEPTYYKSFSPVYLYEGEKKPSNAFKSTPGTATAWINNLIKKIRGEAGLDDPSIIKEDPKKPKEDTQRAYSPFMKAQNFSPYGTIGRIGPDFLSHKFDAYFVWDLYGTKVRDIDELMKNYDWLSPYEKYILSKRGFAVRVGQITIPHIINEDFTMPFLETEIKKVKSTKTMNNQASFTLRLDQNLIWLDTINSVAGHANVLDEHLLNSTITHPLLQSINSEPNINGDFGDPRRWRAVLKTLSKSWPPGSKGIGMRLKDSELCLVVKMTHLSNWVDKEIQQINLPYFIFENVRILGTSDKITYTREGSDTQSITINFIFKRCYEVKKNISHTEQFKLNKKYKDSMSKTNEIKPDYYSDQAVNITEKTSSYKTDDTKEDNLNINGINHGNWKTDRNQKPGPPPPPDETSQDDGEKVPRTGLAQIKTYEGHEHDYKK